MAPNALPESRPESLLRRFLRQFRNPVIYILLFAWPLTWRSGGGRRNTTFRWSR
ncbi:MAG: cation-transporting P-type ATPase [Gammaproteobacteria bacterium]